jgi:transcriptional regulator NrdR family protein
MKEKIVAKCTHCGMVQIVTFNGRWVTEDSTVFRKVICEICNDPFLIKQEDFKDAN